MKKLLSLMTLVLFAFILVGCGGTTTTTTTTSGNDTTTTTTTTTTEALTYEIALITDVGNIDDKSFNEGAWNGVVQYAEEHDITYAYYRPTEDSDAARVEAIESAIDKGAQVVVCPGYLFETAIYETQDTYPDVAFLLLDGQPQAGDYATYYTGPNTHNVLYQEEQAGFLAGYAAVEDGLRDLGFVGGMAVPAVVRYGYGFVQGAEYAANELGLSAGEVTIRYYYADAFQGSPELETKMDLWYQAGVEAVFACGGKLYTSVVAAAENASALVIGVDVDQHAESDTIITSAMKGLTSSVYDSLTAFYDNGKEWPAGMGGQTSTLGAANNGVGLPTNDDAWRFSTFTVAEYEAIFDKLVDGTVVVSNDISGDPGDFATLVTVTEE